MANCGIDRIDGLYAGAAGVAYVGPGDSDVAAVAVIQDLLSGHGQRGLPNLLGPSYGIFGPATTRALQDFCLRLGLPGTNQVDRNTLQRLVMTPAATPMASRAYLTMVLDVEFGGLVKVLSVVAQMEGAGKFAALNLNTDKAGLSVGLIQWAQKPRRLYEILSAFSAASRADYVQIFGAGDQPTAQGLLAHTAKVNGGVDPQSGKTVDSNFDLVCEPWVSRFQAALAWLPFQKIQVGTALAAFGVSLARLQQYAPDLHAERSVAFMLDLANQFGDGGARKIYAAVHQDGMSEADILSACAEESVHRIQDPFKPAAQLRRQHFQTTSFLSDQPFAGVSAATTAL
jgi:hypothetical protein